MTRPTHAYVPGRTDRHPEGCFDTIRDTARPGMSPEDLAGCAAFQIGLTYLEAGYDWEAHELLEPVWMALPEGSVDRRWVQALIQLANAQLKLKMDKPKAARRLCNIVRDLLPEAGVVMGVDVAQMVRRLESLERESEMNYNA